jgi:hypothetical protein
VTFILPDWLPFVIALVVSQALGFAWYGKALFGKAWMEEIDKSEKQLRSEARPSANATAVVSAALMILVLANVLDWAGAQSLDSALYVGILVWLGFVGAAGALLTAFEGRSWRLWAINNGYHLVNILLAAIVLILL